MNDAIGLIETKGLLALIEATDAMAKAANVAIVKRVDVGGGLVTTVVSGDVGSVRAAVDWANERLPAGAAVWISLPPRFGELRLYRLRPDLVYAEPSELQPTRPHYLIFLNRPRWFHSEERTAIQRGELVHQEAMDGVPLSFVYRLAN